MASKKAAFTIGSLILITVTAAIYAAAVPLVTSRQYVDKVDDSVRSLKSNLKALDVSTSLPLMTDASAPVDTKKNNAVYITKLISTTRQQLAAIKTKNGQLAPLPYSNIFGQYNRALVLHDHTERFIGQTEGALDDYMTLIAYLEAYNKAIDNVTARLNDFNNVTDLNAYSGQSESVQQVAAEIRGDADQLSTIPHPNEVAAMNTAAVVALNEPAKGFDDLANGLAIPADDPIYASADEIEDASTELDRITNTMYEPSLIQSRAVKNIHDFSEKLDLVLET